MTQSPDNVQCANVRALGFRTFAHYPPVSAPSGTHSSTHYEPGSLKALAAQRLQENSERTLLRTFEHTLPETAPHITSPNVPPNVRLLESAAEVCTGLDNVTPADVLAALEPEDIADWQSGTFDLKALRGFVLALSATRYRELGIAPIGWNKHAHCDLCGDVYLWAPIRVAGCSWCWNRRHNVKIPRPPLAGNSSGKT